MPPCGQATRRVSARRVAAYVEALSLAALWGVDPTNSLTADDFGDVAVVETGLLSDIADGQAILLCLRESLAARGACLRAFALNPLLSALKLSLSAAYLGACPLLFALGHEVETIRRVLRRWPRERPIP